MENQDAIIACILEPTYLIIFSQPVLTLNPFYTPCLAQSIDQKRDLSRCFRA